MSRKTSTVPTRIYKFGVPFGPAPECAEAVDEQLRLARRYRNQLIEIEKARRWAYAQAPEDGPAIRQRANRAIRDARRSCGVYWGTYLLVEEEIKAASRTKAGPQFRRWDGRGRVGVQIQSSKPLRDLVSDTRLRLTDPDARGHATASLRIGSQGRAAVWADFPVKVHRKLPFDANIKWAWVQRAPRGNHWRWDLCVVMESATFIAPERVDTGTVGFDQGWRRLEDGSVRLGCTATPGGVYRELRWCDAAQVRRAWEYADSVRGIRDEKFNAIREQIADHVRAQGVPEWVRDACKYARRWRSPAKLIRVASRWQREGGCPEWLDTWRRRERHLYQLEADTRQKAIRRRADAYAKLATYLARANAVIVVEKLDVAKMSRKAAHDGKRKMRRSRVEIAPAEFRTALRRAASKYGCEIVEVDPAYTSRTCHGCRHVQATMDTEQLMHTCERCGVTWDRDENAAANILDRGSRKRVAKAA